MAQRFILFINKKNREGLKKSDIGIFRFLLLFVQDTAPKRMGLISRAADNFLQLEEIAADLFLCLENRALKSTLSQLSVSWSPLMFFVLSPLKKWLLGFVLKTIENRAFIGWPDCADTSDSVASWTCYIQTKPQILNSVIAEQSHSHRDCKDVHGLCSVGRLCRLSTSLRPKPLRGWNTCGPAACPWEQEQVLHPLSIRLG